MKVIKADDEIGSSGMNMVKEKLSAGGVIIFPTETVYGIGACFSSRDAVERIFKIKGRDFNKPLAIFITGFDELQRFALGVSDTAKKVINRFWPGPVTFIFNKKDTVPDWVTRNKKTVGIRFPDSKISLEITKCCRSMFAATSANVSGRPSSYSFEDAYEQLGEEVDLAVDSGPTRYKKESTVVDLSGGKFEVLREGAISKEEIFNFLGNI